MSWSALAWAVRQQLPSTQKLVLIMLAERHNSDTGRCDPSHERLAEDCGLTRRSVMDQVKKLEESGYIRAMNRAKGALKLSNHYVLNLSFGVPEKAPALPNDPFLVVKHVHQGGETGSPGVVNHVPNVVNDVHQGGEAGSHKPVTEPVKEPLKKERAPRMAAPALPRPDGVTEQTWADWLALRKAKNAPVSMTVLTLAIAEAEKASLDLENFLQIWCLRGSQGLQADWLKPADLTGRPKTSKTPVRDNFGGVNYGQARKI
ncbi:helix-turn-helix domain-containing protein [Comamonas sp. C11]|uniref:helix-turn-helix domain-containing protein n=1 Tax=Comamonas sp. C11 TaxID=2966554 RepID=UPI0021134B0F|nr:helix-turn-helix domain-containing protein [Comamonas sp. C11]UUC92481.1 helix-turn-helix domain-containing protein [Comamonas sp. C11]UUC92533.1 helix-turn-helix domain-containing protein [Comamonas sp. C11]